MTVKLLLYNERSGQLDNSYGTIAFIDLLDSYTPTNRSILLYKPLVCVISRIEVRTTTITEKTAVHNNLTTTWVTFSLKRP